MSQREGNSKPKTLDNIVHGFVVSVAHEHDHQIDLLKASPSFAAGTVTEFSPHPESSSVVGQKRLHAEQLPSLKENQLFEETTDTFKFSDFSFLPQRSTLTETVKTLMIDSYELSNDTLSVVRVPPKSKRLFSAALIVANAVNTSVNSLTSDSVSKDSFTNDTKSVAIPVGFKETVIASSPANNLKKEKKSRGTSRLNAVLKETSTESILENQLEMLQKRFGRVRNRLASKGMHKCRESKSGCSVDDPVIYDKCYSPHTQVMELANVTEGNEVDLNTSQRYSEKTHGINSQRVIECRDEDDSDIDEQVIHSEIFQHRPYDDHAVVAHLIECDKTDLINIPKKKIKKKKNQVVPISFSFRKKILHSKLEAKIEKQYRIMKEYLKVATLSSPSVDVALYCRWNPRMIESCGHTTELIIYTMKAFFMTNSGLHVNWIHCPEEKFERLIERGAQMKFRKDFPERVLGVLTLSYNASVLLRNPQSNLLSALCELLEIHRDELVVVEVNVK
ncbi:uncharacterized protein LOC117116040 [Anneissia japonica]|uniref:uncharacterized protein LOC117116040 n=1 Tax=Anneissia japonica TaxID=1529436 RepID=UPI001425B7A3|nr:uncharacterized protein LOC117116040 [Anneissia japonica]XP_033115868.1 uncharacterized protein LOC117116040 [Anneissia japonica]XP_033115869.1 uncharacterized protein LOC117116040 [Anneissia japonica]XP_033115870.1 uncharacterized protein LOC117116040 [Anneissia japonica]